MPAAGARCRTAAAQPYRTHLNAAAFGMQPGAGRCKTGPLQRLRIRLQPGAIAVKQNTCGAVAGAMNDKGSHIAIIAPPLRGHLDPLCVLGEALIALGHRVTVLSDAEAARLVPPGLAFHPLELPAKATALAGRMAGPSASNLPGLIGHLARRADALGALLPAELHALGIDLVIADQTEPAAALAARALGLRLVSVAAALPLDRDDTVPPAYLGWRHAPDQAWLYRGGYRVIDWMMKPVTRALNTQGKRLGLRPIARAEDLLSDALQIAQILPGLDYPRPAPAPHIHRLGPFRRARQEDFPLPYDPRPLVFCSLGTLQGGRADIFEAVAEAADALGLRLLIAHGGLLSPEQAAALPGHPLVYAFVPQRAVLAQAQLAVIHGGMNTALDAMALGVPSLVLPIAFDQDAIAARIVWRGAGIRLSPRRLSGVRAALETLLHEPQYREAAAALRAEAADAGGEQKAAALIHQLAVGLPDAEPIGAARVHVPDHPTHPMPGET